MQASDDRRLLFNVTVPIYRTAEGLWLEDQACNGLRLWAEHFAALTVMIPVRDGPPPPAWRPIETVGPSLERIRIVPLPWAWRPDQFLRAYRRTRNTIRAEIAAADMVSFAIGGLFGDWGAVACHEAYRMGRPYGIWTDRVESEVVRRTAASQPWRRRLMARLTHRPMAWLERHLIRRAALGMFHGKETYDTYAPHCRRPELVHDIHIAKSDHIPAGMLAEKRAGAAEGPLRIGYVGRASAMKGGLDWVAVLRRLAEAGVAFRAFWLGDGSDLPQMRDRIAEAGLDDHVEFPGFVNDRAEILARLRAAQVFLFCHKTPESPRCLIEALISATPIVGYEGAFARDLIAAHGGGRLVPLGDVGALAAETARLAGDRAGLAALMDAAGRDGMPFNDESVFRHRCELLRRHL